MGPSNTFKCGLILIFQSTHPVWDGTTAFNLLGRWIYDFNPPIPCGMGLGKRSAASYAQHISIHPSRVGWDVPGALSRCSPGYFNPPIPCGMGRPALAVRRSCEPISIHPSRVGWDGSRIFSAYVKVIFQSTHPVWDGTSDQRAYQVSVGISIHPSRVGWDVPGALSRCSPGYFNPPIPCGMGLNADKYIKGESEYFNPPIPCGMGHDKAHQDLFSHAFQSTHPVWDGTITAG